MLNAAMVLMILAGILGLPAAGCSGACAGIGSATGAGQNPGAAAGQHLMENLMYLSLIASAGSIVVGVLVKRLGKTVSGVAALVLAGMFAALLIQANLFGLPSAALLVLAAIMIFIAPRERFRDVQRVEGPPPRQ
jgi:hypothetical protein